VTRGVGTVHVNVRLFCPPEITCFDITNTSLTTA
jgi:predicted MPP superfamily phosphohydrolase